MLSARKFRYTFIMYRRKREYEYSKLKKNIKLLDDYVREFYEFIYSIDSSSLNVQFN